MPTKISVAIGDIVIYCREDYVGRVDQHPAMVLAVYDDNFVDLAVTMSNAVVVNERDIRYDPDGKPSSWHPKEE